MTFYDDQMRLGLLVNDNDQKCCNKVCCNKVLKGGTALAVLYV